MKHRNLALSSVILLVLAMMPAVATAGPGAPVDQHCVDHETETKVEVPEDWDFDIDGPYVEVVSVLDTSTGVLSDTTVTIDGTQVSFSSADGLEDATFCIKGGTSNTGSLDGLGGNTDSIPNRGNKSPSISYVILYTVTVDTPVRDTTLEIEKSGPPAVFTAQDFEFTVEVTNTGIETAANVVVVDTLPAEGTFLSSSPTGTDSAGTLTVPLGDIAPGATALVSILWEAPSVETTLVNTADAAADNAPVVTDDHSVEVGTKTVVTGGVTAAGTGLRNRDNGDITITDVPADATVTRAVLTWAVLYSSSVPSNEITFEGETIAADLTQTISSNLCWGDSNTIGFAADVTHLVSGNGVYAVTDPVNGIVREDSDPVGTLPYTDGATLMVFYGGDPYDDQVLSDFTYSAESGGDNVRNLTGINSTGGMATLFLAGPDGQNNFGERVLITGAGTLNFDNSWDGSDPQEGPDFSIGNLWDTDVHDVSSIVPVGQTTLDVNLGLGNDCTGLSAVALQVEQ